MAGMLAMQEQLPTGPWMAGMLAMQERANRPWMTDMPETQEQSPARTFVMRGDSAAHAANRIDAARAASMRDR